MRANSIVVHFGAIFVQERYDVDSVYPARRGRMKANGTRGLRRKKSGTHISLRHYTNAPLSRPIGLSFVWLTEYLALARTSGSGGIP